jgi:hypothetical protein
MGLLLNSCFLSLISLFNFSIDSTYLMEGPVGFYSNLRWGGGRVSSWKWS